MIGEGREIFAPFNILKSVHVSFLPSKLLRTNQRAILSMLDIGATTPSWLTYVAEYMDHANQLKNATAMLG